MVSLSKEIARFILVLTRPYWKRKLPRHGGLYLWIKGSNADLYENRVRAALDLLTTRAPVHLRWLQSTFEILIVDQLLRIMREPTRAEYQMRFLALNPYIVWHDSIDGLALYLVGHAVMGRLGSRFRRTRPSRLRASRRALLEMIQCARAFPDGATLAIDYEKRLGEFEEKFPESAA
jgi:hypothetical protein